MEQLNTSLAFRLSALLIANADDSEDGGGNDDAEEDAELLRVVEAGPARAGGPGCWDWGDGARGRFAVDDHG